MAVFALLTCGEKFIDVAEFAGTVGVGEQDVLASCVAEAMSDSAAFAAVLLEGDHADGAGGDADAVGVGVVSPGTGRATYRWRR